MTPKRPRQPVSITARLVMWLLLATTVLWCAAVGASLWSASRELNEAFDRSLQETGRRILPLAADDILGHEQDDGHAIDRMIEGETSYFGYQIRDANGTILLRSRDAPQAPYARAPNAGFATVGNFRLFTETDNATQLSLTIAETMNERWESQRRAAEAMLWPLVGLVPLNIWAIWLGVGRAMRPVAAFSHDISTRSGHNLDPIDSSRLPGELRPIALAVARLMDRLKAALEAERAFAANSAHEMRTPIAGALAQTQRLQAELVDPRDRRRAADVETTIKRLSVLTEKLLQLSRVEAGFGFANEDADLIPALDLVIGDCRRRLDDSGKICYQRPANRTLVARVDLDAFAIVMRNLIDNAINHGAMDAPVDISIGEGGVISVANEGPVVAPARLANLRKRFVRGESKSGGSGLGLAIVDTIMRQIGGRLELASPATGRDAGFEARVTFAVHGTVRAPESGKS